MANISIKKDFEDGQKLFAQQLNNNFETIELGINAGNKLIWKDDNGAEFQTFRGTTEEIENRPIIDGQELYNIENGDTFLDVGETRKDMNKPLWKDDNGAQVQSFRGTTAEVAARPIIDGQTLYNIETGETALDVGDKRISTGAGNVVYIGDEEPQNDATKIWIENNQVLNLGSEVAISSEEPTTQEKVWIQKGNNLIDLSLFETKTVNDVTFTNNGNGTITINGIANGAFGISFIKLFLKAGIYSFNSNSNENMYLYDYDTNTNILSSGGNATFNQDYNNVGLDMYIEQGTVFSNVLVSPMLNMGSQLPFEKYIDKKIYVQNDNGVYEEFYNEEKIDKNIYSTMEQRIGTWLGKPLYRKVIQGILDGTYTENGFFYSWIPYHISNLGICVDLRVHVQGTDRQYTTSGDQSSINGVISGTAVQVGALSTIVSSGATVYIIMEYTKTTD